jgi:hypothetical protein
MVWYDQFFYCRVILLELEAARWKFGLDSVFGYMV